MVTTHQAVVCTIVVPGEEVVQASLGRREDVGNGRRSVSTRREQRLSLSSRGESQEESRSSGNHVVE